MTKNKEDKWLLSAKILIALSIGILFLWALGKSLEIIQTPLWMNMVLYFTIASTFGGFCIYLGKLMERLKTHGEKIDILNRKQDRFDCKINDVIKEVTQIAVKLEVHDKTIDGLHKKI